MLIAKNDEREIIQILRAFAIILVVYHHVCKALPVSMFTQNIVSVVNLVHVVLFMVISGWLFEKKLEVYKRNACRFVKKKVCQLLVPYFWFSFSFSMMLFVLNSIPSLRSIAGKIVHGKEKTLIQILVDIVLYRNVYFESLWYIYVLFILMMLIYVLKNRRFIKARCIVGYMLIAMIIKAYAWLWIDLDSMVILNGVICYFPWIMFGRYLYSRYSEGINLNKSVFFLAMIVLFLITCRIFFVDLSLIMGFYLRAIWKQMEFLAVRICFLVIALGIAKIIYCYNKHQFLRLIGDYSYDIYLIHNPWIVSTICLILKNRMNMVYSIFNGCIIALLGSILISCIWKKTIPGIYKMFFGRLY